jgi:hypothetical protein
MIITATSGSSPVAVQKHIYYKICKGNCPIFAKFVNDESNIHLSIINTFHDIAVESLRWHRMLILFK